MKIFDKEFGNGEQYRGKLRNQKYDINKHIHQFSEIIYVFEGEIDLWVDDANYRLKPNDIAVITPFQLHEVHTVGQAKFWMCVFSNNCVPNYLSDAEFFRNREYSVFKASELLDFQIRDLLLRVSHPLHISGSSVPRNLKATLYTAFTEFVEGVPEIASSKKSDILSRMFIYIHDHYKENITLKAMGKELGYNPKYLSQCLSDIPNMSFPTIVNSLRIDHAKALLIGTNMNISSICYECGYGNEQSFHRSFLKITGTTPADYRKSTKR